MQVTITEINEWEGETFSYILDVNEDILSQLKEGLKSSDVVTIEENTTFTTDDVDNTNSTSSNSYMDRIGFYEIRNTDFKKFDDFEFYEDLIYKGVGLKKIVK